MILWIKISHRIDFGENKSPYKSPAARRLILYHIRDQRKYTPKIRLIARKNNLLQKLI